MLANADLHIHSPYSMAVSGAMHPEKLLQACVTKGLHVLGTGDALQPDCKGPSATSSSSGTSASPAESPTQSGTDKRKKKSDKESSNTADAKRAQLMSEIGRLEAQMADADRSRARELLDAVEHWASLARQYTEELRRRDLEAAAHRHAARREEIDSELRRRGLLPSKQK